MHIEAKCQYAMYVRVIKPELIFDPPHGRTSFGKLLQKEVIHRRKRTRLQIDTKHRSSSWTCYKLDRKYKAFFPNNTFRLGLDLETVVIGGGSSWKWRPMIKFWNMNLKFITSPVSVINIWMTRHNILHHFLVKSAWHVFLLVWKMNKLNKIR